MKEVFHHDGVMDVGLWVVGGCGGREEVWAKRKKKVNKNIASKVISDLSAPSNGSVTSLFFFQQSHINFTNGRKDENETRPQSRKQLERRIGMVILFTMSKI